MRRGFLETAAPQICGIPARTGESRCLQRFKFILNDKNINLNIDDENNYLNEHLTLKKLNLKAVKNLSVFLEKIYL